MPQSRTRNLLLWGGVLFYAVIVIRCAWVSDDAYITFRTVDNFIHGYGLTWNPSERVQVYTHPLWMFLVSAIYFFTREIFYSSIALSVCISLSAVALVAFRLAVSFRAAVLGIVVLVCSKAFVDYATSGLENPLTHLLLAAFFLIYLKPAHGFKALLLLSLMASLGLLNRLDTALLFLPPLAHALWKSRKKQGLYAVLLGFLPLGFWACFSLFYYGFLLPNTAYAKLNTGIPALPLAKQGLYYLWNALRVDHITLPVIAAGLAAAILVRRHHCLPIGIGIALYLLYTVKIGGDFMSGRFLAAPLFCAVIPILQHRFVSTKKWAAAVLCVIAASLLSPFSPLRSGPDYGFEHGGMRDRGIEDQRGFLYRHAGLLPKLKIGKPTHHWATDGEKLCGKASLAVEGAVGYFGFYAGPKAHILDIYALTDPLLSRLPAINPIEWRIGHFARRIPAGYKETLHSGQNRLRDRKLATYYTKLRAVTRGRLFEWRRLAEIWRINTGQYDGLLNFDFHWYQNLGLYLAKRGKQQAGYEALKTALSLDPTRADGWYILARFHYRAGHAQEARAALAEAVNHDPEQPIYQQQLRNITPQIPPTSSFRQRHLDSNMRCCQNSHL